FFLSFLFQCSGPPHALPSFPTRRSSDLMPGHAIFVKRDRRVFAHVHPSGSAPMAAMEIAMPSGPSHSHSGDRLPPTVSFPYGFPDRKSTRLNSSHDQISYAVFCLKKKKK